MLPTQPETPTIPEEEEDGEEDRERTLAEQDDGEGVEVVTFQVLDACVC